MSPPAVTVLERTETPVDDQGIKTVTEIRQNEDGQKVKVVMKVRVERRVTNVLKSVENRKQWKKFGLAAGTPPGPEPGITSVRQPKLIDFKDKKAEEQISVDVSKDSVLESLRRQAENRKLPTAIFGEEEPDDGSMFARRPGFGLTVRTEEFSIRISNLPPDADEEELRDIFSDLSMPTVPGAQGAAVGPAVSGASLKDTRLFSLSDMSRRLGGPPRVHIARDREPPFEQKGFGFVAYRSKEDAEKAIQKFQGFGYRYMRLQVEWAKPSTRK